MSLRDDLGDRMKVYEQLGTSMPRLMPGVPAVARIDGRAFHSFCRGLKKPWDARLSDLMEDVSKYLVEQTGALMSHTASDEISLVFGEVNPDSMYFGGRLTKLNSTIAAMASVYFNSLLEDTLPGKAWRLPTFDCRAFSVPTREEAVNCLVWRELDATRNSVLSLAQFHFSHAELQGHGAYEMQEMLHNKGVNWNDTPDRWKRGTYMRREYTTAQFTTEELERLPEKHHARQNPNLLVVRREVKPLCMAPLLRVTNRVEVVFEGAQPCEE